MFSLFKSTSSPSSKDNIKEEDVEIQTYQIQEVLREKARKHPNLSIQQLVMDQQIEEKSINDEDPDQEV